MDLKCLLFIIFFAPFLGFSQDSACSIEGGNLNYYTLDSLNNTLPDLIFVHLSNFEDFQVDQYIKNLETIYCESRDVKDNEKRIRVLINLGIAYYAIDKYKSSQEMYESALTQLESFHNLDLKVDANVFMSVLLFDMKIIEGALYHANIFKDMALTSDSVRWKGDAFHTVGRIHHANKDYEKALEEYMKALDYYPAGTEYVSKGYTYHDIGEIHLDQDRPKEALNYYLRAKDFWEGMGHKRGEAQINQLLSGFYDSQGDFETSNSYIDKSIEICRDIGYKGLLAATLFQKSTYWQRLGTTEIKALVEEAASLADEEGITWIQKETSLWKSNYYSTTGEHKKALENYKDYYEYSSLMSTEHEKENLRWLEKAYYSEKQKEYAEKQQEYAELKMSKLEQDKTINYQKKLIVFAGLFLFGVSLFSFFYYRMFRKGRKLNIELKRLNSTNEKNVNLLKAKQDQLNEANKEIVEKNQLLNVELSEKALALSHKYELVEEINKILSNKDLEEAQRSKKIGSLLLAENNDSFWDEFEHHFTNANASFYESLSQKHKGLTPSELKLSGLLKMNLSTKEIASITFRSPDSVKVSRSRLRKKLQLNTETPLPAYLNSFPNK